MSSKVWKSVVIGCGNIFPMHAVPIVQQSNAQLVAVCDTDAKKAENAGNRFSCAYYTSLDAVLEQEAIDVVHLCLPHHLHAPYAIRAMQHGCHVLTEKPMSIALADAQAMLDCAEKTGKVLGVMFQNRYNAGSQLIKQQIQSGALGRVLAARMILTWNRSEEYYSKSSWKGTWEYEGGGVIIDQAVHTLDLMRWFVDEPVTQIKATLSNHAHPNSNVEDTAEGCIVFANGVCGTFYAMNHHCTDTPVLLELTCENGTATMDGPQARVCFANGLTLHAAPNPSEAFSYGDVKSYWGTSHIKQIHNFYDALSQQGTLDISAQDAFLTQQLVCQIYDAAKAQRG